MLVESIVKDTVPVSREQCSKILDYLIQSELNIVSDVDSVMSFEENAGKFFNEAGVTGINVIIDMRNKSAANLERLLRLKISMHDSDTETTII